MRRPGLWMAAASLALCLVLLAMWARAGAALSSQQAAERWQAGDRDFAQVSAFISEDAALTDRDIQAARQYVDETLAAMLGSEEEARGLWTDAYSAEARGTVTNGVNTRSVRVVCTGGDWFSFHPQDMASGWWYEPYDLMDGLAVLDEHVAWQLFGGEDVTGMEVYVNGQLCTVAGVARVPEAEREEYGDEATVYVGYDFFSRAAGETPPITCYEAVLPEAVKGFGQETVSQALGLGEEMCELRRDTGRFSFARSLGVMGDLVERSQRTGRIYYPFWENAARAAESRAGLYAAGALLAAAWPAGYGIFCAARGIRRRKES